MARIRPSLHSLPLELIEEVIIISTLLGNTRAAATLARTCRKLHTLVYRQEHHCHLWRQMFLVLFDDPRPARAVRTYGRAPRPPIDSSNNGKGKLKNRPAAQCFPWEGEYKLRIWTESFILRRTRPPPLSCCPSSPDVSRDLPSTDDDEELVSTVLETLLRVISTAAPLPYDTLVRIASRYKSYCPTQPHPIFSPLFIAAHARPCPCPVLGSRNTTWLARVLAYGLPHALMSRLTAFDEDGLVNVHKEPVKWDGLLAKLVAQIGLMATPSAERSPLDTGLYTPLMAGSANANADTGAISLGVTTDCGGISSISKAPIGTSVMEIDPEAEGDDDDADDRDEALTQVCWSADNLSSDDGEDQDFVPQPEGENEDESASDQESESVIDGDEVLSTTGTSATTLQDGLRRLARIRVYNMAYLRPSRAFGPFLPPNTQNSSSSNTQKPGSSTAKGENDEDAIGSPSIVAPPVPPIPDTNFFLRALAGAVDGTDLDDIDSLLLVEDADDGGGDNDDNNDERDVDANGDADVTATATADGSPPSESPEGGRSVPSSTTPASPIVATTPFGSGARWTYVSEIPGDQLRFDWAWIAAARQVIELNLRDLLISRHQGVLRALLSLDGLRSCSAPGFPPVAPPEALYGDEHEGECGPVFEDGEGWDWAGVEGQWRCVVPAALRR